MQTSIKKEPAFADMPEDDLILLESLVKSPVFGAFKRLINRYRGGTQAILMSAKDTQQIFQGQGHMIGLNLVEGLPGIVVRARTERLAATARAEAEKQNTYRPEFPIGPAPKAKKPKS